MKPQTFLAIIAIAGLIGSAGVHADPPTLGTPGATTIGEVRVQNFQAYSYAYVSGPTTIAKIQDAIALLMPKLDAAQDSGAIRPLGPVVFTYHNATMDPNTPITLDIGVIIKDTANKPAGIQFAKVGPLHCATLLFCGPIAGIGDAYQKLFTEIAKRGLKPTAITREVYLYWEGADSANNLVQIQADLQPDAGQGPTN